jgi:hypothetical protein
MIRTHGYHKLLGGLYVTGLGSPPHVPLGEAVRSIARIFDEYRYQSACDQQRAWANAITIGLKLGGLLKANAPIQYAESPEPGCGKSWLQDITAAIYAEVPYVATRREGGVGGLDETLAQGMASGRCVIKIDNVQGELDSNYLASAVTHERITARVPYRKEIEVDPSRHCFMINTNGANISRELVRRFSIVRILKRPIDFEWNRYAEGDTLQHVKANQAYYLGCVFAIASAWNEYGKPRTNERRHSFTGWAQALDWIMQNIFETRTLMFDDYDSDGNPPIAATGTPPVAGSNGPDTSGDSLFTTG